MELDVQTSRNIQKLRSLKGYSQEFMANKLEISVRAYSKIENNETQLSIKRLNEIATVLEITPERIMGFDAKQIFNNCTQEDNIGINNIYFPKELKLQYDKRIELLENEVEFLRRLISKQ